MYPRSESKLLSGIAKVDTLAEPTFPRIRIERGFQVENSARFHSQRFVAGVKTLDRVA